MPAEGNDHTGIDELDLAVQIGAARRKLNGERITVSRRPALDHIGDVHGRPIQTDKNKQLVEKFPCLADEWPALLILVKPGTLSDKHHFRTVAAFTRNGSSPSRGELTQLADRNLAVQRFEVDGGGTTHAFILARRRRKNGLDFSLLGPLKFRVLDRR